MLLKTGCCGLQSKRDSSVTLEESQTILECISRIIVYETPDTITVTGILYLIKGTTLEDIQVLLV